MSFNWRLLLAPERVLDYVVWHEVCHLQVMDHSPRFWALLERGCRAIASRRRGCATTAPRWSSEGGPAATTARSTRGSAALGDRHVVALRAPV